VEGLTQLYFYYSFKTIKFFGIGLVIMKTDTPSIGQFDLHQGTFPVAVGMGL
jgi:hypothetical protein